MERDSFIFYRSFYEAIRELKPEMQAEVYNAIFEYSLNLIEPELTGLPKTIFTLIKPQIEANNRRYLNGKKGGRPSKKETKPKPKNNQDKTKKKPKNNQDKTKSEPNVNDNDNDNGNDNERDAHGCNFENKPFQWLKQNYPTMYEQGFAMEFKTDLDKLNPKERINLVENFNDTVIVEGLEWDSSKILARLRRYSRNWLNNNQIKKKKAQVGNL